MYTVNEVEAMLSELVDEIPNEFFVNLNGGIVLLDECKPHPESQGDLFIMGEYCYRSDMGRQIFIYYGSFIRMYGNASEEAFKEQLRHTLRHELTHHLESQAGERGLEIDDAIRLNEYRRIHRPDSPAAETPKKHFFNH